MNKKSTLKVFCKELNFVALMYEFNPEEEAAVYHKLKNKIEQAEKTFLVKNYVEFLLRCVLVEGKKLVTALKSGLDTSEYESSLKSLYENVLQAYPHFCLEAVCADLNSALTGEDFRFVLEQMAKELNKETVREEVRHYREAPRIKSLKDIISTKRYLNRVVIGQEEAIGTVVNAIKVIAAGLKKFTSFFFVGPTGVGKTKLAKEVGRRYSPNFFKVNCAEYIGKHEYSKLIGAPPGYVGHTDKSVLAEKADISNRWVFLFDEIEKADSKFYDFLLSLLDEGVCTDNMGVSLDFSQSIFIFTSNQGLGDLRVGEKKLGFDREVITYTKSKGEVVKSLKGQFNPEFLNRIDHMVFFNEIDESGAKKIASLELKSLPIKRTAALLNYIVREAYSLEYGARNIAKFIQNDISLELADAILMDKGTDEKIIYVPKFIGGKLTIEPKQPQEKKHGNESS
jgi:ATP-dependent Clp protease ATP-binding subunit ClpA